MRKVGLYMDISMFDIIDTEISNNKIVDKTMLLLQEKYKKIFSIKRIGNRYNGENDDWVTMYCSPKEQDELIFSVKLNKDQTTFEDNYMLRCVSHELEQTIKNEFEKNDIKAIAKVEIIGKNTLKEFITVEQFINKYNNTNFLAYIIVDNNMSEDTLKQIYESLNNKYSNIFLKSLVYIVTDYNKCYENIITLPSISNSLIEKYGVKNKSIMKIFEGKIEKI